MISTYYGIFELLMDSTQTLVRWRMHCESQLIMNEIPWISNRIESLLLLELRLQYYRRTVVHPANLKSETTSEDMKVFRREEISLLILDYSAARLAFLSGEKAWLISNSSAITSYGLLENRIDT